jgi:hypothetical protein
MLLLLCPSQVKASRSIVMLLSVSQVAEQVQETVSTAVRAGDMEVFSVAYARQVLSCVNCDACKNV